MGKNYWTRIEMDRDYPHRWATPKTVQEGKRLCHAPTKTWFKFKALSKDKKHAVGYTLDGKEYHALLTECYHEWDPAIDKRKPGHA